MHRPTTLFALLALLFLAGCAEAQFGAHLAKSATDTRSKGMYKVGKPYKIGGTQYHPQESFSYSETGIASWYGPGFHGKSTANGERFDTGDLTAAHRTLQMPSLARVTNLENGRSVVVRINDRGPYSKGRVIDVSSKAADLLGFKGRGTAKVRVDVLGDESRRIAEDARMGKDTRGYEIALNSPRGTPMPARSPAEGTPVLIQPATHPTAPGYDTIAAAPVEAQPLPPIAGHIRPDGRFLPDPVVTHEPVHRTSLYIQAGSFSSETNARSLSQRLSAIGQSNVYPTTVSGQNFYRVRVGPFATVADADRALAQVSASGASGARIVVD